MTLEHTPFMSVEDYLELEERNPDVQYEYFDGSVYMMSGGSANHATTGGNVYALLKSLLRGGPCRVYNSDIKVRVSAHRYFHPDVTVTCDPRDRGETTLLQSPRLIVEVLSLSTEAYDRGAKLQAYLACSPVEEYVLVNYRVMCIEIYRKEQRRWIYDAFGPDDDVELTSLTLHFRVRDAYEDVMFADQEDNTPVDV